MEYSFGEDVGISEGIPKETFGATFRESIFMGTTYLTYAEIDRKIDRLRDEYPGNEYHMVLKYGINMHKNIRNCNNFSNSLCMSLLGEPIPNYVNRCAYIGSFFSCLFPKTENSIEMTPVKRFAGEANHLNIKTNTNSVDVIYFNHINI